MGSGYDFKYKKCKTEYSAMPGIGMMFPRVYQGAVEDIKNGKYGPEWQQIMNAEEFVAVNAEREVYICSECNHWELDLNLALYRPKDAETIRTKQYGIKTVEEWGYVPYVMGYNLKAEYSLIKVYVHKCKKCGKRMHKAKEEEIQNLPCPKCGTENTTSGLVMWD